MHTEEEANQTVCPHLPAIIHTSKDSEGCDIYQPREYANCIGSKCSQWRWEKRIQYPTFPAGSGGVSMHVSNFSNDDWLPETHNTDKGYCGLAGKP